jgi:hypothetical protein
MLRFFFGKNNFWIGLLAGFIIPFVAYALLLFIFDFIKEASGLAADDTLVFFRARTSALLAICLNIIPMQVYKRKYFGDSMRGLVIPTIVYAAVWIIYFGPELFN